MAITAFVRRTTAVHQRQVGRRDRLSRGVHKESGAAVTQGAIGVTIRFTLKDEVKASMDEASLREHLGRLVEEYKKVPGLMEKTFFTDPTTLEQGAFLVFRSRADWDTYIAGPLYKEAVLDICEGDPTVSVHTITATLKDGVVL